MLSKDLCLKYLNISRFNSCKTKEFVNFKRELLKATKNLDFKVTSLTERLYWILNDIKELPICTHCEVNKVNKFISFSIGYKDTCGSVSCANKKRIKTSMEKYGVPNPSQTKEAIDKLKNNENWKKSIFGSEINKASMLKIHGVDNIFKKEGFSKIARASMKEKYGDEAYNNTRARESYTEKTGNKNSLCEGTESRKKAKNTNLQIYGVDNVFKLKGSIRISWALKGIETCKERYGDNYKQILVEKNKKANLLKYGVEHTTQVPYIAQKIFENSKKYRTYLTPSGKEIKLQGYEPYIYNQLLDYFSEEEIISDRDKIPNIKYIYDNKKKIYYPDFYIPKENLIIEVKSTYTVTLSKEKQILKYEAVKRGGYTFCLEVLPRIKFIFSNLTLVEM